MKKFLVCTVVALAVLSLGLVLIHCGGGGEEKQCETNEDCPQGYWCDRTVWECKVIDCIPNCTGKCCGDDGCGGTCTDNCPNGYECNATTCVCESTGCTSDSDCTATQCCLQGVCTEMSCGNGTWECGYDSVCTTKSCGTCTTANTHCDLTTHTCVADVNCTSDGDCQADECCLGTPGVCTPMDCTGRECGNDPVCGKSCGTCNAGEDCVNGVCQTQGTGSLGSPCTFGDVNATAGNCNTGLECLGIAADGTAGTCPGGNPTECTNLLEEWNRDCVGSNCGASFCSQECDAGGGCPDGFVGQDVGDPAVCMCVPAAQGAGEGGDPCPWNDVNASYDDCQAGLACLGNEDIGDCPGGQDSECTSVADTWNPDCQSTNICGFSFCSEPCGTGDTCPTGFYPGDVSGSCYCIPEEGGTSQMGEPCPFGGMNASYDFCASGLSCLGNDDAGTCPGGSVTECTDIPDIDNPDCVGGICGFSFCAGPCDAGGNCPNGFVPSDVGGSCYCVPGETGNSQAGDPCPFGDVNSTADFCAAGLACLGMAADGTIGTCTIATDCTTNDPPIPANQNPDCVGGNCGASFCADECDASGNCPTGFAPQDVSGTCYCVPA